MPSCTSLLRSLVGLMFLLIPLQAALAQAVATPTDSGVRERVQQLEQTKDRPARLQALQWLQKHAAAKEAEVAIPVLERTIRDDPDTKVRDEAVMTLYRIARAPKRPCPLAVVQAIFDPDVFVRQTAGALATQCSAFPPGTVELALRASWSEDEVLRIAGLDLLSRAAPRDQRTLAVLETAKNDRSFLVRSNSHVYKFKANDKLDEFLYWLIRLQEDKTVLDPVPKDEVLRKKEEDIREMATLAGAQLIVGWCEKRQDELAAALLQVLDDKSPLVRRGAVRLIGASVVKTDLSKPQSGEIPGRVLEKSNVAPCLEKRKARERLEELSNNDPDSTVREAARWALDRLARLQVKP
jgi:hypothetical protein